MPFDYDPLLRGTSSTLPTSADSSPARPWPLPVTRAPLEPETPFPLPAYEVLGQLPDAYGTKKLFLVARDPNLLFAYWDLTAEQYQEAASLAHDGKIFLEVDVPGEGRAHQVHVWAQHKNWFLLVNRPNTSFVAQLGYYRPDGGFEVLARSGEARTPRADLSPNTNVRFVTIPFHIAFQELYEIVSSEMAPGEELVETMARLQESDFAFPFQAQLPPSPAEEKRAQLSTYLEGQELRRTMVGSFEVTEILRKKYESALSSGQWISSGAPASESSPGQPFGASFGAVRGFHFHVNAELIIYGGTQPNARVRVNGQEIALTPDGTFAYHFVLPDGQFHIPISATSPDRLETREALLSFVRLSEMQGEVRPTGQPELPEPIGRVQNWT